jgi:hypothetical protein
MEKKVGQKGGNGLQEGLKRVPLNINFCIFRLLSLTKECLGEL